MCTVGEVEQAGSNVGAEGSAKAGADSLAELQTHAQRVRLHCSFLVVMPSLGSDKLTRKERRKSDRKSKSQTRVQAWAKHRAKQRNNRPIPHTKAVSKVEQEKQKSSPVKSKQQVSSWEKRKMSKRKRQPTKFEKYLAFEERKTSLVSSKEDLASERRLGKKLKVKDGLFHDTSDGLSDLLDGLFSSANVIGEMNKDIKRARSLQMETNQDEAGESDEGEGMDALDESESDESSMEGVSVDDSELDKSRDLDDEEDEGQCFDEIDEPQLDVEEADMDPHLGEHGEGEPYGADVTEQVQAVSNAKESKAEEGPLEKYVAPHRRSEDTSANELAQLQRRTRGLLNRLSEDNVESIAPDIFALFPAHGRRSMTDIVTNEILGAVCSGPRGNEQYAAVFAAFVAGVASSIGMDFGAKFLASFAKSFEEQRKQEDSLSVRNMVLLLSYIYVFKMISCDVMYDLLCLLIKNLSELDVSIILTLLQTCGMGLRADDPVAMKDFVLLVQHRCEELKSAAIKSGTILHTGKRMEFMIETICEIKNNKRKAKQEKVPHARLKKWLQKLGVEEVQLRALKWMKLLDPDKKGQWWIAGDGTEQGEGGNSEVTEFIHKETAEAEKMLQLAALQKMNTGIRRAIFCVVMSGEDYVDAFEKISRIKLTGKQDREVVRVIIECCLQEKMFNKYYSLLIGKLCHHDKNHKFTLQYCLWDHFKQLTSMETRRLSNLANLLADLIAKFTLSLSVLKVVEFGDAKTMTPNAVLFFSVFLRALLTGYNDEVVSGAFSRIASAQELEGLRLKLSVFLRQHLMKGVQVNGSHDTDEENSLLLRRLIMARKAMASSSCPQTS